MSRTTSTYFYALTIRKHLLKMRFERSGRGQEPSRGHKFPMLENFLSLRDFTSTMRLHFRSDLVGACLPQTLLRADEEELCQFDTIPPTIERNRAFPPGNSLLYISLSYVDFSGCVPSEPFHLRSSTSFHISCPAQTSGNPYPSAGASS